MVFSFLVRARFGRDATRALRHAPGRMPRTGATLPRAWCRGLAARLRGDTEAVHVAMVEARANVEKIVSELPRLSRSALRPRSHRRRTRPQRAGHPRRPACRRAILPVTNDSINGELLIEYLALIYAWTGAQDLAVEQLATPQACQASSPMATSALIHLGIPCAVILDLRSSSPPLRPRMRKQRTLARISCHKRPRSLLNLRSRFLSA